MNICNDFHKTNGLNDQSAENKYQNIVGTGFLKVNTFLFFVIFVRFKQTQSQHLYSVPPELGHSRLIFEEYICSIPALPNSAIHSLLSRTCMASTTTTNLLPLLCQSSFRIELANSTNTLRWELEDSTNKEVDTLTFYSQSTIDTFQDTMSTNAQLICLQVLIAAKIAQLEATFQTPQVLKPRIWTPSATQ